jgi:hypothetical protein
VADNEHPERKHIERAPAPPPPVPTEPTGPTDPEQYRQFEQFQQFQQFLKFQETQGGLPPAAAPPKEPLWKRILRSWLVRKVLSLVLLAVLLLWAYDYFFGKPADDGLGAQGAAGPGQLIDPGRTADNPRALIDGLYRNTSSGMRPNFARNACLLLTPEARVIFARDLDAPDCEAAVRNLDGKVGVLRVMPSIDPASKGPIEISSCEDLRLAPGTRGLGKLTLSRLGDGWIISGHAPEPDPCPTVTTTPPSSTR